MALDPNLFFYSDGTITLTNGSDLATGDLVAWDPAVLPFDFIFPNNGADGMSVVKEVLAVNQIRLAAPWPGPTLTNVPYFMLRWVRHTDPRLYALRVSDYLTRLKAIPENLEEIAADIDEDAAAVAAAMVTLAQIEANVDADRQAAQTAAGAAQGSATAAAQSAAVAQQWSEAASSGVLPDNGVTNAKLADVPANTIKGRVAAGTGDPSDLTAAQVKTLLALNNVDNTSDANKPISTAQQAALDGKAGLASSNTFTNANAVNGASASLVVGQASLISGGASGTAPFQASGASGSRPAAMFITNGASAAYQVFALAGVGVVGSIAGNGGSGIVYNTTSDHRLKDIDASKPVDALARVKQLKVYRGRWKADETRTERSMMLAHEVATTMPEVVTGEKDAVWHGEDEAGNPISQPVYQQVDYQGMIPDLVAALQEAVARIEELEARLS